MPTEKILHPTAQKVLALACIFTLFPMLNFLCRFTGLIGVLGTSFILNLAILAVLPLPVFFLYAERFEFFPPYFLHQRLFQHFTCAALALVLWACSIVIDFIVAFGFGGVAAL